MKSIKKVFQLSCRYLRYCPPRQRRILALGVVEFALLELYANVVNPAVVALVYGALEAGEIGMLYERCAISAAIVIIFCILCYVNDVYVDLNCFKINESILTHNCMALYELPYDRISAEYDDSQIQARLDDGSGSADSAFIFAFVIASNVVSIAVLLAMSSAISWLLLVITALSTLLGALMAKCETRCSKKYEPMRQRATSESNAQMRVAALGIITSNMNDMEDEVYRQYKTLRAVEWDIGWKRERASLLMNAISSMMPGALRSVLGLGMYPYYSKQRLNSANVAASFSVYSQMCSTVKEFARPFGAISSALVNLDRMDELIHTGQADRIEHVGEANGACIQARDICYAFGEKQVLKHIDLSIRAGEKVALIGHNGSGKSTLLRALCGLSHPQQGYAMLGNVESSGMDVATRRNIITCIPANAHMYDDSARENILMNAEDAEAGGYSDAVAAANIDTDITGDVLVATLSGGQVQRVNIARGLVHKAPVLIADEPTSGLPTSMGASILRKLLATYDTCLVATHQRESLALFTRVIVMEGGRIVADMPAQEYLNDGQRDVV